MENEEIVLRKYIQEAFLPIVFPDPEGLRKKIKVQIYGHIADAEQVSSGNIASEEEELE